MTAVDALLDDVRAAQAKARQYRSIIANTPPEDETTILVMAQGLERYAEGLLRVSKWVEEIAR